MRFPLVVFPPTLWRLGGRELVRFPLVVLVLRTIYPHDTHLATLPFFCSKHCSGVPTNFCFYFLGRVG